MKGNITTFSKISGQTKYEGRWVIILKKKVVFSGTAKDVREEMARIRKEHPDETPLVAKVPRKIMQIV